jgi:hypothetical protein
MLLSLHVAVSTSPVPQASPTPTHVVLKIPGKDLPLCDDGGITIIRGCRCCYHCMLQCRSARSLQPARSLRMLYSTSRDNTCPLCDDLGMTWALVECSRQCGVGRSVCYNQWMRMLLCSLQSRPARSLRPAGSLCVLNTTSWVNTPSKVMTWD